jgi:hypothetical protein
MLFVGLAKPPESCSFEREYPGMSARTFLDEGADVVSTPSSRHTITT